MKETRTFPCREQATDPAYNNLFLSTINLHILKQGSPVFERWTGVPSIVVLSSIIYSDKILYPILFCSMVCDWRTFYLKTHPFMRERAFLRVV